VTSADGALLVGSGDRGDFCVAFGARARSAHMWAAGAITARR